MGPPVTTLAVAGPFSSSPLWYITRSTGITAFVVLTATTVLGVAATQRAMASRAWPRFATQQLHRNLSLLGMLFLLVHIVTTLLDSYVHVGWLSFVVPFWSPYRTLGVTLGTVAFDLLLLVVVSSLLRLSIPARTWRLIHYLSYAAWPLALLHFLVTGTDTAHDRWGIWLGIACAAAVLAAVTYRVRTANPPHAIASVDRSVR
jgi:methionine sulfoxide reductase heme-binding subunit